MATISEDIQKINNLFPKGRLRRTNFILLEILSFILVMLSLGAVMDHRTAQYPIVGALLWILWIGLIILQVFIVSKRLQDCGFIALFSLLMFVPWVNCALTILLCIYPGQKGTNKFGLDPRNKDINDDKLDAEN